MHLDDTNLPPQSPYIDVTTYPPLPSVLPPPQQPSALMSNIINFEPPSSPPGSSSQPQYSYQPYASSSSYSNINTASSTPLSLISIASETNSTTTQQQFSPLSSASGGAIAASISGGGGSSSAKDKQYYCQRCTNHGVYLPRKNHKPECRFKECTCDKCIMVEQRRQYNNELSRNTREFDERREKPPQGVKKVRQPVCKRCSVHGERQELKGHKKSNNGRGCPYLTCECTKVGETAHHSFVKCK